MMTARVIWRFGLLVVAATVAGTALVSQPSNAQGASPDSFDVSAQGASVIVETAVPAALPLQVETGAAVSTVKANSQPFALGEAAPVYFPLAGLLAADTPVPGVIACTSHAPGEPAESSCGGPAEQTDVISVGAAAGSTSASSDPAAAKVSVQASARVSDISPAGDSAVAAKIEGAASAATASPHEGRMTSGASAVVQGIEAGGVLRIASVRSRVSVAAGGTPGTASRDVEFSVSGAEVAGIPVTIDENGATVDREAAAPGLASSLQDQVNAALDGAGLSVQVAPAQAHPDPSAEGTLAEAKSPGLQIRFSNQQSGVFAVLILARSEAQVVANQIGTLSPPTSPTTIAPQDPQPAGDPLAPTAPPVTVREAAPAPPAAPEPGASAPPPSDEQFLELGAPIRSLLDDWLIIYPPFALLVFTLPALFVFRRLPISTSRDPFRID